MRKLHLVGLTTDRDGLIFTARKGSKSGGYIVPLDKKVLAAIAAASDDANGEPPEPAPKSEVEVVPKRLRSESALTPREMQARLRAGRTIDEVAAEAGVDTEWVARFAVPILAEQAQVVELARGLVYAKPRLGESTEPLGASVVQNLSDKGVFLPDDVTSAGWSAFQLHDSVWMVRFRYRSRGRDQEAHWEIDVPTGRLRARNRLASDLGYVGPDRWRADDDSEPPADDDVPPPPPAKAARRRPAPAPARRPAAKAPAPARRPPAAKKAPARSAAPARTTRATPARSTAARNVKAAASPKRAVPRKGAAKSTATPPAPARKGTAAPPAKAKGAAAPPAKSASRRRATKAVPAPEAGPTAGSGGVRMAVARVSTARVAASMATADREPWAAAVRRPTVRSGVGATLARPPAKQAASRERGVEAKETVGRFEPRPLPPPGSEPLPPRVRKVTLPRPRVAAEGNGSPPVSLPSSRRQAQDTDVLPAVERPKRRRLRSR